VYNQTVDKIKIISTILILICLGLICNAVAYAYLPKADLIKGSGPEVYILENGARHWIPDPETFNYFRFKWQNIKTYSDSAINSYVQGDDWSQYDGYPDGSLVRGSGPKVYLIELGKRRWIPNPHIFEGNDFGWKYILGIDQDDLEDIDLGSDLTLSEPNRYPETIILESPAAGATLETAEVFFKYSGTNPLGENSDLDFETYLKGYDSDWQNQGSNYTEEYDLEQSGTYTFYVRAKNEQGYYDPSPASLSFQIGVSLYYQKVEISNVYENEGGFNDYLVLRNESDETINITNWTIKTSKDTITIPKAAKKLTYPYSESNDFNVELSSNDEAIISVSLSPIGTSFQDNKCTGYLDLSSQFHLSLDNNCPDMSESVYDHLGSECQEYIVNLDGCAITDFTGTSGSALNSMCTNFLNEHFSYGGCYDDYNQDADFLKDEWRIFLNKSIDIFDNNSDTVILKDANGFVVHMMRYIGNTSKIKQLEEIYKNKFNIE